MKITFDYHRLAAALELQTASGLSGEGGRVAAIVGLADTLEHKARRFKARRDKAVKNKKPVLANASLDEIRAKIHEARGASRPAYAAAFFNGMEVLQMLPAEPGGAERLGYLAKLFDEEDGLRAFPTACALCLYFHPLNEVRLFWIGDCATADAAVDALRQETSALTDWSAVHPPYQAHLDALDTTKP